MRIGMISAAHVHASSYADILKKEKRFDFVGIWDENVSRGKKFSSEFEIPFFEDLDDFLEKVEVIIITSENSKHFDHVMTSSGKVKGILCEKPLALSVKQAEEMINKTYKDGTKLGTAFPVRFHPASRKIKEIFDREELGKPLMITSSNRGKLPPGWFTDPILAGGGAITDHVVHLVDLFRWFTGREFSKVQAFVASNIHPDLRVEDSAVLSLELGDIPMTLDCSWSKPISYPYWGEVTFRVIFENGVIEADIFSQNLIFYSNIEQEIDWINFGDNADREMLIGFADWVEGKREDFPTGYDGLKATQVVEKAYEALERKEEVLIHE